MDIGPELALAVGTILFSAGVSWGVVKNQIKRNGNGGDGELRKKVDELDKEIRSLKVLVLGIESSGGIVVDIRELKNQSNRLVNKIQALHVLVYGMGLKISNLTDVLEEDK